MKQTISIGIAMAICLTGSTQSVPNLINYQGRLTDQSGASLSAGMYAVQFRIWDTPTGSNLLVWAEQQNVTVQSGGFFNALLGTGTQIHDAATIVTNLATSFAGANRFLGLTLISSNGVLIFSPDEILPRQQLLSVPFAMLAQSVAQGSLKADNVDPQFLLDILQPPGSIIAFGGPTNQIPLGWLLCDGRGLNSGQYSRLFGAVSKYWGSGAGTNDFNLPDLRGLFLRGVDPVGMNDPDYQLRTNRAGVQSSNVGSTQQDALRLHIHTIQGGFFNGFGGGGGSGYGGAGSGGVTQNNPDGRPETRPKNAYVNYIIKY
jgi:hypothetical protein